MLIMGDNVFVGAEFSFNISSSIFIRGRTRITMRSLILDVVHGIAKGRPICDQQVITRRISIGSDCWLGAGSIVLMGVDLQDGEVVGDGGVATKSIPACQVWAGVPARRIKERSLILLKVDLRSSVPGQRENSKTLLGTSKF
jgi:acetyltransferase-like isoleucine patch superfamily enzyme